MRLRLLTLLTASTLALASCGDDKPADVPIGSTPTQAPSTPASTPPAGEDPAGETPAAGDVEVKKGECADVPKAAAKSIETPKPEGSLPTNVRNILTLKTSCGEIKIELDAAKNPKTANSVATMAKNKYYDGTGFDRIVPGFVIQGGDPTATQSGGPPWNVVEAPAKDTKYTKGVVAMAKTGAEAPGTSGSQFFIVVGDDVGLGPDYAVAGKVVKGQDVAELIAGQGSPGVDGPPNKPVVILSATVETKPKS